MTWGLQKGRSLPTPILSIPSIQVSQSQGRWVIGGRLKCICPSALKVSWEGGDGGRFAAKISTTPCTDTSLWDKQEKGGAPESWEAGTWRHSEGGPGSWLGMGSGPTRLTCLFSLQFQLPSPPNPEDAGIFQLPFPLGSIALIQAAHGRSNGWAGTVPEGVGGGGQEEPASSPSMEAGLGVGLGNQVEW